MKRKKWTMSFMIVAVFVSGGRLSVVNANGEPSLPCELGTVCDGSGGICKEVTYRTLDGDCLIEVGEKVDFETRICVTNHTHSTWTNTTVGDCFFRDVDVTNVQTQHGTFQQFQAGNDKTCIRWKIGDLGPHESAILIVDAETGVDR